MNRSHGALLVRGERVPAAFLHAIVDGVTRDLESMSAGPERPVAVAEPSGLVPVVAMMAAARLGAALVFGADLDQAETMIPVVAAVRAADGDSPVEITAMPGRDGAALPDDIAAVFCSSGSTGEPKVVMLSRAALKYQGLATRDRLAISQEDEMLVALPLNHAYGFSILQMWRRYGPTLNLQSNSNPHRICASLTERRVTTLDGVPSFYRLMLRQAERNRTVRDRLRALRIRGCGGAVLPRQLYRRFHEFVGAPIHDGYGLTEAGPNVALTSSSLYREGTVGLPLAGTEVRVAAEDGELFVRGPGLMTGYYDDDAGTAAAFTEDGWLRTGDLGEVDEDGFVRVVGRRKDVLIVHGELHSPHVVEEALRAHALVVDAAVVGVLTDAPRGDTVVAFVETGDAASIPNGPSLRAACRVLPPVLRPAEILVVTALPRLPTGKLDRREIRRMAHAQPLALQRWSV